MPSSTLHFRLDQPATHIDVKPGGKVIIRGSFHSTHDGTVVDAATTTWPSGAPGGTGVDRGGLIDFAAGGFHVVSRNPDTHEVIAVATDGEAPACAINHVSAPCLPIRAHHQAHSRLITVKQWTSSLKGAMQVEVVGPPAIAPVAAVANKMKPVWIGGGILASVVAVSLSAWVVYRRWSKSAKVQLRKLAKRVRDKATTADPILAGTLMPALDSAMKAIDERKVDPASDEGKKVIAALKRVDAKLDKKAAQDKAEDERRVADDLVSEVEIALEAAGEAARLGPR
ncbi:MAG: hypothetical protein CSA75_01495 [Sorangium cellulosum]|nr:MAG: hypothetical protein CSA75_01495 [Sorangium cellulosum]